MILSIIVIVFLSLTNAQTLTETEVIEASNSANSFRRGYTFARTVSGTPWHGSLISFGGFNKGYDTQINADYGPDGGNHISFRTLNGDLNNGLGVWNSWNEIWHSGNLNNDNATFKSKKILVNENLIFTNHINRGEAGNKIQFNIYSNIDYGAYIKSLLYNAQGDVSMMALRLGSYWKGEKNELTLRNEKVGINISDPKSNLHVFIPSSSEIIEGLSVDVASFVTQTNKNESVYFQVRDLGVSHEMPFIIKGNGNVGIGINKPQNKLDVNGTIHAKEVKVDLNGWADYVFKTDYKLPSLEEVEAHIKEKGHLPSIPSEKEVLVKGINLGDNQRLLLQKIEELTLYSIEQNKQLQLQSKKIEELEKRLNNKNQ